MPRVSYGSSSSRVCLNSAMLFKYSSRKAESRWTSALSLLLVASNFSVSRERAEFSFSNLFTSAEQRSAWGRQPPIDFEGLKFS
jgi:hypothetical protein